MSEQQLNRRRFKSDDFSQISSIGSSHYQILQENLKELKKEIRNLERISSTPYNKKSFQMHAKKSQINDSFLQTFNEKEVIKRARQQNGPFKNKTSCSISKGQKDGDIISSLVAAKENFIKKKYLEINEVNETYFRLLIEADKIKREELLLKEQRIFNLQKECSNKMEEVRKQFDSQTLALKQQLQVDIDLEDAASKESIRLKLARLEQNSLLSPSNKLDTKYTPALDSIQYSNSTKNSSLVTNPHLQKSSRSKDSFGVSSLKNQKISKLQQDILHLQKINQKQATLEINTKQASNPYNPILRQSVSKPSKTQIVERILTQSSDEDDQFLSDYRKYKENHNLKTQLRQKDSMQFWESTQLIKS